MSNLSEEKRKQLLEFIKTLKEENSNNQKNLIALNEIETELQNKKYGLVWEKHEEKVNTMTKNNILVFSEIKDKEINQDIKKPYNFLLEGDNLHSLKLLEKTHKNKIDVIYIDPPYNTNNQDFIYNDKMVGADDEYRHSKWLSFMSERLEIAQRLLKNNGAIFISIDDSEQAQLKILCDQIFGEKNFISTISVKTSNNISGQRAKSATKTIVKMGDYIHVYAKDREKLNKLSPLKTAKKNKLDPHYCRSLIDNKIVSWKDIVRDDKKIKNELKKYNLKLSHENLEILFNFNPTFFQYFIDNYADKIYQDTCFTLRMSREEKSRLNKGEVVKIKGNYVFQGLDGKSKPRYLIPLSKTISNSDDYGAELCDTAIRGNHWDFSIDNGNIGKEGGVKFTNGKKPVRLIKNILKLINNKNAIVLDFFAGSGTTGQAVIELNKEDGGRRKYILCTNNENNICENVTYQRLENIQFDLPHNLKYYKTSLIFKNSNDIHERMLKRVVEFVQLEYAIKVDGKENILILKKDDVEYLEKNLVSYPDVKTIYLYGDISLTKNQKEIFKNKNLKNIPKYDLKLN